MPELPKEQEKELARLVEILDKLQRRRRITLAGYLLAALVLIGGQLVALYIYGTSQSPLWAWVFFLPFALVGGVLWLFGQWARRVR